MSARGLKEHEKWLLAAESSTDLRVQELVRLHRTERFDQTQWILLWWLGTRALNDPAYRMTAREILTRIMRRDLEEEVSRVLDNGWRTEKNPDTGPARKLVKRVRAILNEIPPGPSGVIVELPEESHPEKLSGAYFLVFHEKGWKKPLNVDPGKVLRPSARIWERMISPIHPQRGWLVYSNEQPEQPKKMNSSGLYSGTGEVAAALHIGLRTAHLNCDVVPCRSTNFGVKEFRERRAWYVFLGSPVSNHGMQLLRGTPPWSGLQQFTFDSPSRKNDPPMLRKNSDPTWRREFVPGGHNAAIEFALITHLRVASQVVVAFSGMTTVGTYSAASFFTDDTRVEELLAHLKIKEDDPVPCFEVVIKLNPFDGDPVSESIEDFHVYTSISEAPYLRRPVQN